MHELTTPHLDDFTLLRYVAADLDEAEQAFALHHLSDCEICQRTVGELEGLDQELRTLAANSEMRTDFELEDLPEGDPFRRRPPIAARPRRRAEDPADLAARAVAASEEGAELSAVILESAKTSVDELDAVFGRVDLSDPAHRFALAYALQKAGTQIAECPSRFLRFAERTLALLTAETRTTSGEDLLVETTALLGQAQQLAGQACLWTGNLEKAGSCFHIAYRFFGQLGDELGLAKIEQLESQRRFFIGNGDQALILARRATVTAQLLGVDDEIGRGQVAEGMALQCLGRFEESVDVFRAALPVFERMSLWSNYVGAVNAMATSLVALGHLGAARRDFARILRRLSRERHRSLLPFIRKGLAEVLFSAGRYREAAVAAAQAVRLYSECGMRPRSLLSSLFEIESWARAGDVGRARHRLELFRREIAREGIHDPTLSRLLKEIFSGSKPNFQVIAELRRSAEQTFQERFAGA